jgi:hypothetical protein
MILLGRGIKRISIDDTIMIVPCAHLLQFIWLVSWKLVLIKYKRDRDSKNGSRF